MTPTDNRTEVRRLRRLLKEIADLAQGASLTGHLPDGAPSAIRRYNAVLQHLERLGVVTPGFFEPLAETAGYDELGVESKLLAGYIKEDEADAAPSEHGPHSNVIIGMGGLRELSELKDLGKMIREQLPAWIQSREARDEERKARDEEREARDEEREARRDARAAARETRGHEREGERFQTETFVRWNTEASSLSDVESRLAEVGAKLQTAAEQLRRGDLPDEDRAMLAEQLSRLGQEQANLARRHALLRQEGRE
jgi:hypothetical protein